MKEFADDNFKFDENDRKFSKWVEKEKLLVTSNFSFSHSVFKRFRLQTCKNQGLWGKGLMVSATAMLPDATVKVKGYKFTSKRFSTLVLHKADSTSMEGATLHTVLALDQNFHHSFLSESSEITDQFKVMLQLYIY